MKKCLIGAVILACLIALILSAIPFAVPPIVERVATEQLARFGVSCRVKLNLEYCWMSTGPGLRGDLNAEIPDSPWRLKADFGAADGTWSMKVYDMGATRPSVGDADGDLVAESADLGFRNPAQGGLSSYCFNTQGNAPVLANDPADPSLVLYDNIVVTEEDRGVAIILR